MYNSRVLGHRGREHGRVQRIHGRVDGPHTAVYTAVNAAVYTAEYNKQQLECGPMPNVMVALPNIGGTLCSTPQNLADAHY